MNAVDTLSPTTPFGMLADYERRSLAHVAGAPEQVEAEGRWRGIGFRIGERRFLSAIEEVNELLVMPVVTTVPGTRSWLLGVANVRGNLMPIIDLHQYLYGERTQISDRSRVLRIHQGTGGIGLLVAEVLGQRTLTAEEQRADDSEDEDERLTRFVVETVSLGGHDWSIFSMSNLVNASDFQHAGV